MCPSESSQQSGITIPNLSASIYTSSNVDMLLISESDIKLEIVYFLNNYIKYDTIISLISLVVSILGLIFTTGENCAIKGIPYDDLRPIFIAVLIISVLYLGYVTIKMISHHGENSPDYFVSRLRNKCDEIVRNSHPLS